MGREFYSLCHVFDAFMQRPSVLPGEGNGFSEAKMGELNASSKGD